MRRLLYVIVAFLAAMQFAFAALDINSAGETELDKLPGIGPTKARAIIDDRRKNGPFKSIEDLKRVKGIGDKTFDDLKGQITVGGGRTASASKPESRPAPVAPKAESNPAPAAAKPPASAIPAPAGAKPAGAKPAGPPSAIPAPAAARPAAAQLPAPAAAKSGETRSAPPAPAGARPAAAALPAPAGAKAAAGRKDDRPAETR